MSSTHKVRARAGFTLIELVVVIAVISALIAVVTPNVFRNVGDAKTTAAAVQLESFVLALEQYRIDTQGYPSTDEGLVALRRAPEGADAAGAWRGPYIRKAVPTDPWGRPWVYRSPGLVNPEGYDLLTLGRDGKEGGLGEDADLTSWGSEEPGQ